MSPSPHPWRGPSLDLVMLCVKKHKYRTEHTKVQANHLNLHGMKATNLYIVQNMMMSSSIGLRKVLSNPHMLIKPFKLTEILIYKVMKSHNPE
jgi:hypothetical protein